MTDHFFPLYRWGTREYDRKVAALLVRGAGEESKVEGTVREIINDVRGRGNQALMEYTARFDRCRPENLEVDKTLLEKAATEIPPRLRSALETAADRIEIFHRRQKKRSWEMTGSHGEILGQRVSPLKRVGVYVPGGRAAYPSTVLMNVIPARVAGVKEVIMVTPTPDGYLNPVILTAAAIAGVDRIFKVGGAQAVAALAYGTETVPRVEKIVGPGNIYVACAKRLVFGLVDIDMIAGPSEVVVIADKTADPGLVAADLLSQAEHDPLAYPLLVTSEESLVGKVRSSLENQLADLPTAEVAREALSKRGAILLVPGLEEACSLVSDLAPEHVELMVEDPRRWEPRVTAAGAIFLGSFTPEPVGDYIAGSNHVLPTGGTARFFSALGVPDFQRSTSLVDFSPEALKALGPDVVEIARAEGLEAHARSVAVRLKKTKSQPDQ